MQWILRSDWSDPACQKRIATVVRGGGLLAYPTDTLYGLGGDFLNPAVHRRLGALKGRAGAPFSAVVSSLEMALTLAVPNGPLFSRIVQELGARALTFVFPKRPGVGPEGEATVGLRLPDLPALLSLIEISGGPWITTSANRSGDLPCQDPHRIAELFPTLDLILDGGELAPSLGSTVIDLCQQDAALLRWGDRGEEVAAWLKDRRLSPAP